MARTIAVPLPEQAVSTRSEGPLKSYRKDTLLAMRELQLPKIRYAFWVMF